MMLPGGSEEKIEPPTYWWVRDSQKLSFHEEQTERPFLPPAVRRGQMLLDLSTA
jgi:hypothetical protein